MRTFRLNTFRQMAKAEEAMMRAVMPQASANDTARLEAYGWQANTVRSSRTLTAPLTFTMQEMAR